MRTARTRFVTESQIGYIVDLAARKAILPRELRTMTTDSLWALSVTEASNLINRLKTEQKRSHDSVTDNHFYSLGGRRELERELRNVR